MTRSAGCWGWVAWPAASRSGGGVRAQVWGSVVCWGVDRWSLLRPLCLTHLTLARAVTLNLQRPRLLGWVSERWPAMLAALLLHGALVVGFMLAYGRWLDEELVADVCLFGLVVELVGALLTLRYLQATDAVYFASWGAVSGGVPGVGCHLSLLFDEVSGVFVSILIFALVLCFFFLVEYFEYDAHATTIITLSALFSQAALVYFCAFDVCLLLFFWELISFVSFLLVQHWAFRLGSYKAGLKVFTVSQFGDLPLFFFCFLLLARVDTAELGEVLAGCPLLAFEYVMVGSGLVHLGTVLALTLQVAVFLKAAQWVFYPWLLDAMEAPVPISAQLHSSTLVVIGFYLYWRFQPLFGLAPLAGYVAVVAGLVTSLGASVLGFLQEDGKKLLACSTASQLGYVIVCLGLGLEGEALVLLTFCCCNKAFTFVWFGLLMRRFGGLSDFRLLGGSVGLAWFEHAGLLVAVLNFTIMPGAFCWHVKGLFLQGQVVGGGLVAAWGLGLLQLTWFLSSLYLWSLYVVLYYSARRPSLRRMARHTVPSGVGGLGGVGPGASSAWMAALQLVALGVLVWYGGLGLLVVDGVWAEQGWFGWGRYY